MTRWRHWIPEACVPDVKNAEIETILLQRARISVNIIKELLTFYTKTTYFQINNKSININLV